MRILVCGGRNYNDYDFIKDVMEDICDKYGLWDTDRLLPQNLVVIHGGARGADSLADCWAVSNWVPVVEYKADWNKHGKAAGAIRNQQMLDEGKPDLVVAFPGGRGTADMVRRAKKSGVKVYENERNV